MNPKDLQLIEVKGFCMWPFLKDGQKTLVRKTAGSGLYPGDILLYRGGSGLLCHRLARKEKEAEEWIFYCKPDTSLSAGEPVSESMLEGKVIAVVSNEKIISLETAGARFKAVIILGFLSPVLAILLRWYKKMRDL
jgi:hypothetical protein